MIRPQCAFIRGARGAVAITRSSSASSTASKASPYLPSRSRSRKRGDSMRARSSPARFLACCTVLSRRVRGDAGDMHAPRTVFEKHPRVQTLAEHGVDVEEVRRDDALRPRGQKLPPGRTASPQCRIDARAVQYLPDRRGAQAMTKPSQLAMDPPMSPLRILSGKPEHERPDRSLSGRTPSLPTRGLVPLPGHEPTMPAEQRPRSNRENHLPARAVHQSRQRGEPEPVGSLVTERPGQLPTNHNVLVPQHQKLRILGCLTAKQNHRNRQQLADHLVQQRNDHPNMLAAGSTSLFRVAMTFWATQPQTGSRGV